jgi:hypothetical protein
VLAVSSSGCSVRVWRTVRQGVSDGPRGAQLLGVHRVRREFFNRFFSIHLFLWFWLPDVRWTIREESTDGPWVLGGWSVFSGALLEFQEPISDSPPGACGWSTWSPTDSPPPPCGRSAQATTDCLSPLLLELPFRVALSLGLS